MTILDQFTNISTGHSSTVTMSLYIDSLSFPVLQSSKNAIKLELTDAVPTGDATLETIVDGRTHRRLIRVLPEGPRPNWIFIVDR